MQTELMLRLIKDNKIVGYEWRLPVEQAIKETGCKTLKLRSNGLEKIYSPDFNKWVILFGYWGDMRIDADDQPDSFELGVKVMDDYWFAGDTGIDQGGYGDRFVLKFDGFKFKLIFEDDNFDMNVLYANNLVDCKKTGNIHEEIKP